MAAGGLADHGRDVGLIGADHLDRAGGVAAVGLRCALDREHPGAGHGGELDRGLADLAVAAEHQHHVAGLDAAGVLEPGPGGDERHADGTRLEQADRGRLLAQMPAGTTSHSAWVPSRRMPSSPPEPQTSLPTSSAGPSTTVPA